MLKRTALQKGAWHLFVMLLVTAAYAGEVIHTSDALDCNSLLTPQQKLAKTLQSKKKSITVMIGNEKDAAYSLHFVSSQVFTDKDAYSAFKFKKFRPELNTPENNGLLTTTLLQRAGEAEIFGNAPKKLENITLANWMKQKSSSDAHLLTFNWNNLSIRQQKDILKIYEISSQDEPVHILIFIDDERNLDPKLREQAQILHINDIGRSENADPKRGEDLRIVSKMITTDSIVPLYARLTFPTQAGGVAFVNDVLSLTKTLTAQPVEYFEMQAEAQGIANERRRPFIRKRGKTGTVQDGEIKGRMPLEDWLEAIASKHDGEKILRFVVIYTNDLTESETHILQNWIEELHELEDAQMIRVLIIEADTKQKSQDSHNPGFR